MDIKLVPDGSDILIENNTLKYVVDQEEIRQALIERLKLFKGEWFLNTSIGVPYFQEIIGKNRNINSIATIFKNVILQTVGVIKLIEFELSLNDKTRELSLSFGVNTISGFIRINEVLT